MELSSNTVIAAQGVLVTAAGNAIGVKILANTNAHDAAKLATKAMNKANSDGCKVINDAAVIVAQQLNNNVEAEEALGFPMTSATAQDAALPPKVVNGSMSQGDFDGTCDIHFDKVGTANEYSVKMTKGDPSVNADYVQIDNPSLTYTTSSITIPIGADYLDKPLWFKVTAHNDAGAGPSSEPFGGRKIQ